MKRSAKDWFSIICIAKSKGGKVLFKTQTKKLKASSLIEVIVASIIFMAVFTICLHTITSVTSVRKDGFTMIEVDGKLKQCLAEYSKKEYKSGQYDEIFDWGEVSISITPYKDYQNLRQVTLKAMIKGNVGSLIYRHIIENPDEDQQ